MHSDVVFARFFSYITKTKVLILNAHFRLEIKLKKNYFFLGLFSFILKSEFFISNQFWNQCKIILQYTTFSL
jgi:hypothetical protein